MTYMPPIQPAQPVQPVKPRNNVKTILIVVGVVLLICCGGLAVGGFFLFRSVNDAIGPPKAAAEAYVQDLIEDDYPGAYERICAKNKKRMNAEVFAGVMRRTMDVQDFEFNGVNVSNTNGETKATVTLRLTLNGGVRQTHIFPMVREGEDWKVCD